MGGKTKLLDPERLESLYAESRQYEQNVQAALQTIQKELTKLGDITIQRTLAGQGNELRKSVSRLSEAMDALKENFERTKRFIDAKLAGAVYVSPIRSSRTDEPFKAAGAVFAYDPNLKR
jgi:cob(I)alamin adenosyltransferase